MFIKNPKVTLQSILLIATEMEDSQPLSTNLSIVRDDITGRLIMHPVEVIAQVETHALSPEPTPPQGAPSPLLRHISPNQQHTIPMISGCITPSTMHEALRRTPNHTAAGPDGVPDLILNHMPPVFHKAL
jgi:hypothetical protein